MTSETLEPTPSPSGHANPLQMSPWVTRGSRFHPPVLQVPIFLMRTPAARKTAHGESYEPCHSIPANWFHPVNIPTRPSPNTMRIFLKSVAMRICE
jgi:hypothetical protein